MPVVGAWARVDVDDPERARRGLAELEGVETIDLGDPARVGLVIEADDLDSAHHLLTRTVPSVPGVLCAWPVSVHMDDEPMNDVARSER